MTRRGMTKCNDVANEDDSDSMNMNWKSKPTTISPTSYIVVRNDFLFAHTGRANRRGNIVT